MAHHRRSQHIDTLEEVVSDIQENQELRSGCSWRSVLAFLTGAKYYREVLLTYRDAPGLLRERMILEWTTLGVVSALLLSLSFGLFLLAPRYAFNSLNSEFESWGDIYGIFSSLSGGSLATCCLHFSLYIVNANLLRDEEFSVFVYSHQHILAMPIYSLLAGVLSMTIAVVALGFIGYSSLVAWFNVGFMIYNAIVFGGIVLYSLIWRLHHVFVAAPTQQRLIEQK